MSTRDRILDVSLRLFNEEGEAAQSAVDLANALDMSPGNLYYHFKGKEPIIEALFERFEEEMTIILKGVDGNVTSFEDNWVFTYIVLEEIYDFRFFYRNLGDLLARYPSLASRFRGVLAMKRRAVTSLIAGATRRGVLHVDERLQAPLVDQLLATLTFWLSMDVIEGEQRSGPQLIHDTVLQIMMLIVPYMGEAGFETLTRMLDHHKAMTSD